MFSKPWANVQNHGKTMTVLPNYNGRLKDSWELKLGHEL